MVPVVQGVKEVACLAVLLNRLEQWTLVFRESLAVVFVVGDPLMDPEILSGSHATREPDSRDWFVTLAMDVVP